MLPGFEGVPPNQGSPTRERVNQTGVPFADPGTVPEINAAALLQATMMLSTKPEEESKPNVKEAESTKLPDYPNPETYRSWKISVREMLRAAATARTRHSDGLKRSIPRCHTATLSSLHDTGNF